MHIGDVSARIVSVSGWGKEFALFIAMFARNVGGICGSWQKKVIKVNT